jgi:tetratricopeptide (TPR) repeat protein
MTMNATLKKRCPRCRREDLTDFSTCRFCQSSYSYQPQRKPVSFHLGISGIIILALVIGVPLRRGVTNFLVNHTIFQAKYHIKHASITLQTDPNNYDAYMERAKGYGYQMEYWRARSDYTAAIAIKPTAEAYRQRAICLDAENKYDEAKNDRTAADKLGWSK